MYIPFILVQRCGEGLLIKYSIQLIKYRKQDNVFESAINPPCNYLAFRAVYEFW